MVDNKELIGDMWKHFFNKPKAQYNPYVLKLLEYPEYIVFDKEIMDSYKDRWNEYFLNDNPLYLEIGTGSGNFTQGISKRHKDRNFIGLELRFKRLCLAANKCKRDKLKNVVFLRRRAEEVLSFLGENSIDGLYVNFPDPWEENEKNRVIQESFFKTLDVILKKGGIFYFKTDHDKYYSDIKKLVEALDGYEVIYATDDLHNSEKAETNIKTEFEQLFLHKHNKNINYLEIKKSN